MPRIAIPYLEVVADSEHDDLARERRVRDERRGNHHAALFVEFGLGRSRVEVPLELPRLLAERIQRGESRLDESNPILTTVGVEAPLEAALDDNVRLYGIQTATNTSSPLIIVNGPIVKTLKLNARGNVFGQGNRANATIGRALQLILRNIGGDLPGETDMATHGHAGKLTFCIAENEDESPWDPLHVERGFMRSESTVTVIGGSSPQNVFTYGCETGEEVLEHFIGALTGLGHNNIIFPTGPLFVLSPEHAHTLARDGYNKERIKQRIFENARIPLSRFSKRTVAGLRHRRARWFAEAGDAKHIGVADRPQDINIVVAGGAGIHSQFVPTSFSYEPVTRLIRAKE